MPENKNDAIASTIDGYADKIIGAFENSNMFQNIWKVIKVVGLAGIGIGGFVLGQKLEDSQNLSEMVERVKTFFGKGGPGDPATQAKNQEPIEIPNKAEIESVKPKGDETAKSDKRKAKAEKASSNTRIALDNATKMNKLTERSKEIMSNYGLKSITSRTESIGTANIDKNFGSKTEDEIASTASNAITIQDIAATINTDHIETLLAANNELLATISQQVGLIHTNQVTTMVAKKSKAELMEILSKKDEESSKILEEQNAKVESYTETLMKNKLTAENKSNQNLAKSSDDNSVGGFGSKMTNFPWGKTLKTASVLAMPLLLKKAMEILTEGPGSKEDVEKQKEKAELSEDVTEEVKANGGEYYKNGEKTQLDDNGALNITYGSDEELDKKLFSATKFKRGRERLKERIDNGTASGWDKTLYYSGKVIGGISSLFMGGTSVNDLVEMNADDKIQVGDKTMYGKEVEIPEDWVKTGKGTYLSPDDKITLGVVRQLKDGRFVITNKALSKEYFISGDETGRYYNDDNDTFYPHDKITANNSYLTKNGFISLNAVNSEGRAIYARYDKDRGYELVDGSWLKTTDMSLVKKYMADGKGGVTELTMEGPDDKKRNSSASSKSNTRGTGRSISISNNTNFTGFNSVHGYADALDDSGAYMETSPVGGANIPQGTMSPTPDLPTPEDMDDEARSRALASVQEMMRLKDSLVYSQAQRDPEKGSSDCSSTVQYVLKKMAGVDPGFNTVAQITNEEGTWVDRSGIKYDGTGEGKVPDESKLAPGDVIFVRPSPKRQDMSRPYRVGHAEMYVGNGMLMGQTGEAPGHKGPVYHALNTPWIVRGYIGAKRFIKNKDFSNIPTGIIAPEILNDEKANIGAERRAEIEKSKSKPNVAQNFMNSMSIAKVTGVKSGKSYNPPSSSTTTSSSGVTDYVTAPEHQQGGDFRVTKEGDNNNVTIDNSQTTTTNNTYTDWRQFADPNLI